MSKMMLNAGKLVFIIYFFFVGWYQAMVKRTSGVVAPLAAALIFLLLMYIYVARVPRKDVFLKPIKWWIVFAVFTGATGIFVAMDVRGMMASWAIYCGFLAMLVFVVLASNNKGNADFFIRLFCILAVMYAVQLVFSGHSAGAYTKLSELTNRNSDGITMCIGVFAFLYMINPKKMLSVIVSLLFSGFLVYAIVLTASRKALLCALFLIAAWLVMFLVSNWKEFKPTQKLALMLMTVILILVAVNAFLPYLQGSYVFERLIGDTNERGDKIRAGMYSESITFFSENPIMGIGYNQFRVRSRYKAYSHSTYAELLSCTGIVGTVLWLMPLLMLLIKLWQKIKRQRNMEQRSKTVLCLIMLLTLLLLGVGVILPYSFDVMMLIGVIIHGTYFSEEVAPKKLRII